MSPCMMLLIDFELFRHSSQNTTENKTIRKTVLQISQITRIPVNHIMFVCSIQYTINILATKLTKILNHEENVY